MSERGTSCSSGSWARARRRSGEECAAPARARVRRSRRPDHEPRGDDDRGALARAAARSGSGSSNARSSSTCARSPVPLVIACGGRHGRRSRQAGAACATRERSCGSSAPTAVLAARVGNDDEFGRCWPAMPAGALRAARRGPRRRVHGGGRRGRSTPKIATSARLPTRCSRRSRGRRREPRRPGRPRRARLRRRDRGLLRAPCASSCAAGAAPR